MIDYDSFYGLSSYKLWIVSLFGDIFTINIYQLNGENQRTFSGNIFSQNYCSEPSEDLRKSGKSLSVRDCQQFEFQKVIK